MSANVPPKMRPFNFNDPIADKEGKATVEFQQFMQAVLQRLEGPVATATPASATAPGIPLSMQTDDVHVWLLGSDGTWRKWVLLAF